MSIEATLTVLFCIAAAVASAVRYLRVPYTVALVLTGLGLSALHVVEVPHLTKDLLFAVFLPGLLFEAAYRLEFSHFWKNRVAITALALPGVVTAIVLAGVITTVVIRGLALAPDFVLRHGLVFGALIAATDPVAVTALFRQLSAPARLSALVEGESLLNDGTAVVFLALILEYATGSVPSIAQLCGDFLVVAGGGVVIGAVIGLVVSLIISRMDDAMIQITLTTVAAYGSFILGDALHVSGVIATVIAGLLCGDQGRWRRTAPANRLAVQTFWEYVAFALNSVVFLLIGFTVSVSELALSWREILVAYVAMTIARAGIVLAVTLLLRGAREHIPLAWNGILTWGGLRGALSMVLALALPADIPHRQLLVTMTVGVVVLSLLVQGLTVAPLLRWSGLSGNGLTASR